MTQGHCLWSWRIEWYRFPLTSLIQFHDFQQCLLWRGTGLHGWLPYDFDRFG